MLKKLAKKINYTISWWFVKRYLHKFQPIVIGIVGSVGKTGTKRAVAQVLASSKRVAWQDGNYNDIVTVPLVVFGLPMPSLFNPLGWLSVYVRMAKQLIARQGVEMVVLELGTDTPGDIARFGRYLTLDIAIITAITHEHMEFFGSLDAVAKEELAVIGYSKKVYVHQQIVSDGYLSKKNPVLVYGDRATSDVSFDTNKDKLTIKTAQSSVTARPHLKGAHQFNALAVAAEVGLTTGVTETDVIAAIEALDSMPGRMNVLDGKDGSVLIDDTYNSSPSAVYAALDYLYALPQKRKIAVLGNMNEMGAQSKELHQQVGKTLPSKKLSMLLTIGKDANQYLASAASANGLTVKTFDSPIDIAQYLDSQDLENTAILFKGSQNGVFLEEAVKGLLSNPHDTHRLTRQSEDWMKKKRTQFKFQ